MDSDWKMMLPIILPPLYASCCPFLFYFSACQLWLEAACSQVRIAELEGVSLSDIIRHLYAGPKEG